jgi:phage terminase large subunit GpA-like protein
MEHTRALFASLMALFAPPVVLSTEKWAEANRVLGRESASLFGRFSLDPTPYMRTIYSAFEDDPNLRRIVLQFGAQLAKSEFILNSIGSQVDQDPGPSLLILPTLDLAKSFAKVRIGGLFRDTKCLRGKLTDERARDGKNATLSKHFDGGFLEIVSPTESSLSSRPIRYLYFDEVSAADTSGTLGADPLEVARKRLATFAFNSREILTSTPRLIGCRVSTEYNNSTRELFYIPCVHCGFFQVLDFDRLTEAASPEYRCMSCDQAAKQAKYRAAMHDGEWRPERTHDEETGEKLTCRGFKLNSLYSHVISWAELKKEWREAQELKKEFNDSSKLQVFINTRLAEPYASDLGEKVDEMGLMNRREEYCAQLPAGVKCLTAGADVQENRIEFTLLGWGDNMECWVIDHVALPGYTDQPKVWEDLTRELFDKWFYYADGAKLQCHQIFIDGGFRTEFVRAWAKNKMPRVMMTFGWRGPDKGILMGKPSWKYGVPAQFTGGHSCKADILGTFLRNQANEGPGVWHFPTHLDGQYFAGLTSEVAVEVSKKGRREIEWHVVGNARNEQLDCAVYGYAALHYYHRIAGVSVGLERMEKPTPGQGKEQHRPAFRSNDEKFSATCGHPATQGLQPVRPPQPQPERPKSVPGFRRNGERSSFGLGGSTRVTMGR